MTLSVKTYIYGKEVVFSVTHLILEKLGQSIVIDKARSVIIMKGIDCSIVVLGFVLLANSSVYAAKYVPKWKKQVKIMKVQYTYKNHICVKC